MIIVMAIIKVASQFTEYPGPRTREDWEFSGQEFYEDYLKPEYDKLGDKDILKIDLDWTYRYPSSFLSEVFGRFQKEYSDKWWEKIELISTEDPSLLSFISHLAKKYE